MVLLIYFRKVRYTFQKPIEYNLPTFREFADLLCPENRFQSASGEQIPLRVAFAPHLFADVPDNHRRRNNAMSRGYESRRSKRFFRLWFFRIRILYLQESNRAKRQYYSHADKGHTYN